MSADINTTILVNGTKDQLISFYNEIKRLSEEKHQQYRTQRNCYYFDIHSISYSHTEGSLSLLFAAKEEIEKFLSSVNDTLFFQITGPYGRFNGIYDLEFFEPLAEAVPDCKFVGGIVGFDTGGDLTQVGELEDGVLTLKYLYRDNEDAWDEDSEDDWDEDDEDDWDEEEEPDWDFMRKYDPVKKQYIR